MLAKEIFVLSRPGAPWLAVLPATGVLPFGGTCRSGAGSVADGVVALGAALSGNHGTRLGESRITATPSVFVAMRTPKTVRDRVQVDTDVLGAPPRGVPV